MEEDIPIIKKKRVEGLGGSARLQGEVDKTIEKVKSDADPYAVWSDPKPWEWQGCYNTLREFIHRIHPKLLLCAADFMLERIRVENDKFLTEYAQYCARRGGWKAVEEDIKRAEKWILELYGIEEEEQ